MVDGWNGPLEKVDRFRYQIPRTYKREMRPDGLIFIDEPLLALLRQDRAPAQGANVATMPGIVGQSMAMADIHWGYGGTIGRAAGYGEEDGGIAPGGVGCEPDSGLRLW